MALVVEGHERKGNSPSLVHLSLSSWVSESNTVVFAHFSMRHDVLWNQTKGVDSTHYGQC